MHDADATRMRAIIDLAIGQLLSDAELLEAAGFGAESEISHLCAQFLDHLRAKIILFQMPHQAPG